jgi:uncharacterized membrane protein
MKHNRLDGLSDGVFAIVMTLLIIEIKVPEIATHPSNWELWNTLRHLAPLFASYVLSFALLFTYWKAHHFFTSVYAKNIDAKLLNINAIFLLLIALVPFSSSLLGTFSQNEIAIVIFSSHIILIGLSLYWMRNYVLYSKQIKNPEITDREIHGSTIRTILPVLFSLIAIPLCFISKELALTILTIAVIFNLFSSSTKIIDKLFNKVF